MTLIWLSIQKIHVITPSISFNILTNNYLKNKKKGKRKKVKKILNIIQNIMNFYLLMRSKKLLNYKRKVNLYHIAGSFLIKVIFKQLMKF